jgi:hypothetical protein
MKESIPHDVLSEHLQDLIGGRQLVAAVFITFQFDPGFFEHEVLPVLIDVPLSHSEKVRLVQLEDALRPHAGRIAVYYDANGLVVGSSGSAKLDFQRVPMRHPTGIFHPKNVFLLLEDKEADESGYHPRSLVIGALSANLTRAGWWENVEAAHFEQIYEGEKTLLREDLRGLFRQLKIRAHSESSHVAIDFLQSFLKDIEARSLRSTSGLLHSRFFTGREAFTDFLDEAAGDRLRGAYLEIISPYFDDVAECKPLEALIERFAPKAVRIFLPRTRSGEAAVNEKLFNSIRKRAEIEWARLPEGLLRLGKTKDSANRFVHAKIYRFFTQKPKRELCFVGSVNLTSSAHQHGGNWETGLLVDCDCHRTPDFWLIADVTRPKVFVGSSQTDPAATGGTPLTLRFFWDTHVAKAFWDAPSSSPRLKLESRGIAVGELAPLSSATWTKISDEIASKLEEVLRETSFITVYGYTDTPALLLVQEEGMSHKPSLVLQLSATDILRYWALLSTEQRSEFLETHAPVQALLGEGADLVVARKALAGEETFFNRFAGFFHAFNSLDREVREQLAARRNREAQYRLFGKKYDSLGTLIERVTSGDDLKDIDRYVILLCAEQLTQELERDFADFWKAHSSDAHSLKGLLSRRGEVRDRLLARDPINMRDFLDWFDPRFVKRATPATP